MLKEKKSLHDKIKALCEEEETKEIIRFINELLIKTRKSVAEITDGNLSSIESIVTVRCLNLSGCDQITDNDLACLKGLPNLQKLDLSWCAQITDISLSLLADLVRLRGLNLAGCHQITGVGLMYLEDLPELKILDLSWCFQISDFSLSALKHFPALQTVKLFGYMNDPAISSPATGRKYWRFTERRGTTRNWRSKHPPVAVPDSDSTKDAAPAEEVRATRQRVEENVLFLERFEINPIEPNSIVDPLIKIPFEKGTESSAKYSTMAGTLPHGLRMLSDEEMKPILQKQEKARLALNAAMNATIFDLLPILVRTVWAKGKDVYQGKRQV